MGWGREGPSVTVFTVKEAHTAFPFSSPFASKRNINAVKASQMALKWESFLKLQISVADPKLLFRIRFRIRIRQIVSFGFGSGSRFGSAFDFGFESGFKSGSEMFITDLVYKQAKTSFSLTKNFLLSLSPREGPSEHEHNLSGFKIPLSRPGQAYSAKEVYSKVKK